MNSGASISTSRRELSEAEKGLFVEYTARLKAKGIPYVLLRNYIGFPASIGHDLDLFIRRRDLTAADALFRELLASRGGRVVLAHARDYFTAILFCVDGYPRDALHIDLYHGSFTWHNLPYLTEEELLADAHDYEGHAIPRPAHEALNLFLASILWGGFFKTRYQPRILELLADAKEKSAFEACLKKTFGADGNPSFDLWTGSPPEAGQVKSYAKKLRRAMKREAFRRNPFRTVGLLLRHWMVEAGTYLRPKGLHIAIYGPDGAGKSTILNGLVGRIRGLFGELHLHHLRLKILPDVGVLLGRRKEREGPVTNPHGEAPHSFAAGFFRLAYYWMDYWLGWLPRLLKPKGQVHLVLFDRYAGDWWCDPRRYRFALPQWLLRIAARTVPQPDLSFVLLADAATINQRKGEIPAESLQPILERYGALAKSGKRYHGIDASRGCEEILDDIEGTVIEFIMAREK